MTENVYTPLLKRALERRAPLLEALAAEGTDCCRLFHGIAEGLTGLTVDRYGGLVLAQTFREPLPPGDQLRLEEALRELLPYPFAFAYNHRGKKSSEPFEKWHRPSPAALAEFVCSEGGVKFLISARHRGIDPWLFLDLRAARRFVRNGAKGLSVLNLFAYTCGVGVCAAAGGAAEVWNVDFASSSLEVGRRNAELNGVPAEKFRNVNEDCLTTARQLAGLPAGGRYGQKTRHARFEPRSFDLVFLDPPAWAKSTLAAVDVVRDYPSLFKPALLACRPGGKVIATNHVASVDYAAWTETLKRCAQKAGRPLKSVTGLAPDADFPSFDGKPPLKVAVCGV
ncbi:MAG: class I SAM-dependent methyltransferase [Elusimicrobia bacterium]|nr:class I SAM-dependent methyltransferase [Elusimicrobiota bacterium]